MALVGHSITTCSQVSVNTVIIGLGLKHFTSCCSHYADRNTVIIIQSRTALSVPVKRRKVHTDQMLVRLGVVGLVASTRPPASATDDLAARPLGARMPRTDIASLIRSLMTSFSAACCWFSRCSCISSWTVCASRLARDLAADSRLFAFLRVDEKSA